MMENIPYYDFADFPVSDNVLLKLINSAVNNGFKMILINFGGSFPWSLDSIILSEFSYSEKLIEKIVNICRENNIILVPVLSIMINSDFIIKTKGYNYLVNEDRKINGLDPSATGAGKFIEELIDDIFSILVYSEYLLIELPYEKLEEGKTSNDFTILINRLSKYLGINNKKLIIAYNPPFDRKDANEVMKETPVIYTKPEEKIQIYNGNSYQLSLSTERVVIKDFDYRLFYLGGTEGFNAFLDAGFFVYNSNMDILKEISKNPGLEIVDNFFNKLEVVWVLIRKSHENLSLIYRNTDTIHRAVFLRSICNLSETYSALTESSIRIIDSFEEDYQPGTLRQWVDSKMDSVDIQLSRLKLVARQMRGGI